MAPDETPQSQPTPADPPAQDRPSQAQPQPGVTPASDAPGAVPVQQPGVGVGGPVPGPVQHPEDPAHPQTQSPAAEVAPSQPTEGLGSPTPETTVDGKPAVQQGQETGPAPGPSPDAGGSTQP